MSCHVNNVQSQQGHQTISNISLQFSACFFWCFGPKSPLSSVWRHPAIEKLLLSFGAKPGSKLPEPPGMNTYGALGRVGERHDNRNGDWKKYATYLDIIYLDHSLFFLNYLDLSWFILIDLGKWWWVIAKTWELGHCLTDLPQGALAEENQRQNPCLDERLGGDLGFCSPHTLLQVSSAWCAPLKTYIWYHIYSHIVNIVIIWVICIVYSHIVYSHIGVLCYILIVLVVKDARDPRICSRMPDSLDEWGLLTPKLLGPSRHNYTC